MKNRRPYAGVLQVLKGLLDERKPAEPPAGPGRAAVPTVDAARAQRWIGRRLRLDLGPNAPNKQP